MIDRTTAVREDWHNLETAKRIRAAMRETALGLMDWTHPDTYAHACAKDTADGNERNGMTPFEQRCAREDEEDRLAGIRLHAMTDAELAATWRTTPERFYETNRHVYRPHGRETLYGTAQYADPFTLDEGGI